MADTHPTMNPAEAASERALTQVYACLDRGESFRLEAGAGAGKTYTLVKSLQYLIKRDKYGLPRRHQQIACITFTNVAKDEIESRTDRSPLIYCGTIHAFCANILRQFALESNLARSGDELPSGLEHDLEVMDGEMARLQGLIDDLFLLARAEAGQLHLECRPTDVAATAERRVQQGVTDIRPQLEATQIVLEQRVAELELRAAALAADIALIQALGGGYASPRNPP